VAASAQLRFMPENTVASRTKSTTSVIKTMTSAWPNTRNTFFI
jgi:hypothetical protein